MKNTRLLRIVLPGLLVWAPLFSQTDTLFSDTNFHPLWNKHDLSDWQAHAPNWKMEYQGTDSAAIYADGQAHPGSMTHLIYGRRFTGNLELRAVMRMPATGGANAGLQFRSRCQSPTGTLSNNCGGTPWIVCGPQVDMGSNYSGDIYNGCSGAYVNNNTTSAPPRVVNNTRSCRAASNFPGVSQWNTYRVRVWNDTVWTFLNEVNCTKMLLTAATDKQATTQGIISLQYETQLKVEFRSVELKNLDGKAPTTALPSAPSRVAASRLRGMGRGALEIGIPDRGDYSVMVSDLAGRPVGSLQGKGPVTGLAVPVTASGVLLVEVKTQGHRSVTKVLAE